MTKFCAFLAGGALLLGISGPPSAGFFNFGTLGISIGALPTVTLASNLAGPFTITANGSFNEPAGVFGPADIALPRALFTGIPQISGLTLAGLANGTKIVTPARSPGGGLGGTGGLQGNVLVNVVGLLNLTLPLHVVGSPGAAFTLTPPYLYIQIAGQGWGTGAQVVTGITTTTPGTGVVNTVTFTGSQMGPLSGISATGAVTLVSAFKVVTNIAGNLPGVAFQTLRFVPEPGALLFLGTGVVGLGVVGLRKIRR